MTGQEIAERTPQQEILARVRSEGFQQQIELALPEGMPARRFVRAAVTALMQTPELAEAEPNSLLQSLVRCAQDGLLPDGREAALVMFGGKASYLPMVSGYRKIAAESEWAIRSAVVYENDEFDYELGLDARLTHRPPRPGQPRGSAIAAYAVGAHRDGRREFEVMDAAEIEKVRKASRSGDKGPWKDWPERMWEKTVARRLFKKLPLGDRDRVERVLAADDHAASADVLYGPGAGQVFRSTPAPPLADGAPDVAASRGAGRQAEDAEPLSPAASSAPDYTPPPDDDDEARKLADSAGSWRVPKGCKIGEKPVGGKTVAEIHALGEPGLTFLAWALEPGRPWAKPGDANENFPQAVRTFAAYYAPELLAETKAAA